MALHIVPFYAAALGLLFVLLSGYVIRERGQHQVVIGSGDIPDLERRIRVHGNFAEYVPITLLLLTMAELLGVSRIPENLRFRVSGIGLTTVTSMPPMSAS